MPITRFISAAVAFGLALSSLGAQDNAPQKLWPDPPPEHQLVTDVVHQGVRGHAAWPAKLRLERRLTELRRLHRQGPAELPREGIEGMLPVAYRGLRSSQTDVRLLSIKTLGLGALTGIDRTKSIAALCVAARDWSRQVQRETVLQLVARRPANGTEATAIRAAVSHVLAGATKDEDLHQTAAHAVRRLRAWRKQEKEQAVRAVPKRNRQELASRIRANEATALRFLERVHAAQSELRSNGDRDLNRNGRGEYGFFTDLVALIRDAQDWPAEHDVEISALGVAAYEGYLFTIFLPSGGLRAVSAAGRAADVDYARAEQLYVCYAWPAAFGRSGERVFFVSEQGRVLAADNACSAYSGARRSPHYGAAMVGWEKPEILINDDIARRAIGRDGNLWTEVAR